MENFSPSFFEYLDTNQTASSLDIKDLVEKLEQMQRRSLLSFSWRTVLLLLEYTNTEIDDIYREFLRKTSGNLDRPQR